MGGVLAQLGLPAPQLDNSSEDNLELPHRGLADSSADLSCDSRVNSDYETDGEGYTDGEGGPHTDVDEGPPAPALARSSEPVLMDEPQSPRDHGRASGPRGAQVSRARGWLRHTVWEPVPPRISTNRSFSAEISISDPDLGYLNAWVTEQLKTNVSTAVFPYGIDTS